MCNLTGLLAALLAADIFLVAAMVSAGVAIGINSTIFGAPGAQLPATLAIVAAFAAASSLGLATSFLSDPACVAGGACAAERDLALGAMIALTATMAAATIAGTVAIAAASVPVVGGIALGAFVVGLGLTAVAIFPVSLAVAALQRCIDAAANMPLVTAVIVVSAFVGLVGLAFLGAMGPARRQRDGDDDDPFKPDPPGPIPD
jgi:hypothetical protein